MNDICVATIGELRAAITSGKLSETEVLEAYLRRIDEKNPSLHAIVIPATEHPSTGGALQGIPFTLKDAHAVRGVRSTVGFAPLDHVSTFDGTIAERLAGAGGVFLGKTNVPPLLADYQTDNQIFGRTNHPLDIARTPGGSSGGAAAAVASGMSAFDIGTDLGGSIRVPAHFCGLYGLKPTERRISHHGVFPIPADPPRAVRTMLGVGPITRSLDDLALVYSLIAGPDGIDSEIAPVPLETKRSKDEHMRVGFITSIQGLPVAREIQGAVVEIAHRLDAHGITGEEAVLPSFDIEQVLRDAGALIGMMVNAFGPSGDGPTSLAAYLRVLAARDRVIAAWEKFFTQYDVLIAPPAMTTAFEHCASGAALSVDGVKQPYEMIGAYSTLFNYTGHPAMVVPASISSAGLPIGVQLVAGRFEEARLFEVARHLNNGNNTGSKKLCTTAI